MSERDTPAMPDGKSTPGRSPTLQDLLDDQARRWQAGDRVRVEDYLRRFPALAREPAVTLDLIYQEVVLRERAGEAPVKDDYLARFPDLAADLEVQFAIDRVFQPSAGTVTNAGAAASPRGALTLPGYDILELLGRGGMGTVYKAYDLRLKRLVAVKVVLDRGQDRPADRLRFRAEAEAIAALHHPNIVQIYGVGEHDGVPFFSLEYCPGGSLVTRMWPDRQAAGLVEAVARAVDYAHGCRIVHRDLKPENILLDADGTPKVSDFGLAKRLDDGGGLTPTSAILGTPNYMAPEQAEGRGRDVGPAADVYALGAILYRLLTGRPPFVGDTTLAIVRKVADADPRPPSQIRRTVPRDLETICLKCLQKDSRKRYVTAAALADDLRRYLDGRPVKARPVSAPERTWRWCRRNPALASAVGLAAAALVCVAALSVWFGASQYRAAEELRSQQRETTRLTASLAIDRGLSLCDRGAVADGLLWLSRGLDLATGAEDEPLQYAARANIGYWGGRLHVLRACLVHPGVVRSVAVTPDGRTVVTACADGGVRFWDVQSESEAGAPLPTRAEVVALTRDGGAIFVGSADGTARLWDIATRQPAGPVLPHAPGVLAVACGPDGRTVVTGSADGTAQVWDARSGERIGPPLRHKGPVRAVAVTPNGRTVVTAGADQTARTWRVPTGEPAGSELSTGGPIVAVAVSPDGTTLLTGDHNWEANLWGVTTGSKDRTLMTRGRVTAVAFSPDGTRVIWACEDAALAQLCDLRGARLGEPLRHGGPVNAAAFGPDGRWAVTGGDDGMARVWTLAPPEPPPRRMRHASRVRVVAYRPDGAAVVAGSDDGVARVWDPATGEPIGREMSHGGPVRVSYFSPDSRTLVTAAADGRLLTWDAATGEPVRTINLATPLGRSTAFSPDGRFLLAPGERDVRLWDAETGRPIRGWQTDGVISSSPTFSPDGRTALIGCESGTARFWDTATGNPVGEPLPNQGHALCAAYSPDGRTVLTGAKSGTAQLWDAASGRPTGVPLAHPLEVWGAVFSPDGRVVATCCHDGRARFWEAKSGKPIGPPLPHGNVLLTAAFSPDCRSLLTACWDGHATVWPVPVPIAGSAEQVRLRTELATGSNLDPAGAARMLGATEWHERKASHDRITMSR